MNATRGTDTAARRAILGAALVAVIVTATVIATSRPAPPPSPSEPTCPPTAVETQSVARRWDEALLDAIRRSLPNPPVHARNLSSLVAMWDAWAAYDPTAAGLIFTEKLHVDRCDVAKARNEAISYAADRILSARFIKAVGGDVSLSQFATSWTRSRTRRRSRQRRATCPRPWAIASRSRARVRQRRRFE